MTAYGQSKTANILHGLALDARAKPTESARFSPHPGTIVDTNFARNMPAGLLDAVCMLDEHGAGVLDPSKG